MHPLNEVAVFLSTEAQEEWRWQGLSAGDIAGVISLIIVVLGGIYGAFRWIGKQLFKSRPHLKVEAQTIASWERATDTRPERGRTLLRVSVRSLSGQNSIERFELEWEPNPPTGWEWMEVPAPIPVPGVKTRGVQPQAHIMQQDEFEVRHFEFHTFSDNKTGNKYKLRVTVHLVNGKKYKSKKICVVPPVASKR